VEITFALVVCHPYRQIMFHLSYISILKSLGNISSLKYLCNPPFLIYFCTECKFFVLENPSVGKCYLKIWYDVMYF